MTMTHQSKLTNRSVVSDENATAAQPADSAADVDGHRRCRRPIAAVVHDYKTNIAALNGMPTTGSAFEQQNQFNDRLIEELIAAEPAHLSDVRELLAWIAYVTETAGLAVTLGQLDESRRLDLAVSLIPGKVCDVISRVYAAASELEGLAIELDDRATLVRLAATSRDVDNYTEAAFDALGSDFRRASVSALAIHKTITGIEV